MLDFLVRLGDVFVGVISALLLIFAAVLILIEIFDFLIVDPIKRAQTHSKETDDVRKDV